MNTQTTLSITEARKKIFDIAEQVQKPDVYYTLTENGRPKAVIMSSSEFDSLMETMEILRDPEIMKNIKKAEEEYKKGEYISWEEMKKELHQSSRPGLILADRGKTKYAAKKTKK